MTFRGKITIALIVILLVTYGLYRNKEKVGERIKLPRIFATQTQGASKEDFPKTGGKETPTSFIPTDARAASGPLNRPLRVTINTWGGYAPGLVANDGLKTGPDSIYGKKYGLKVEFLVIDDWDKKAAAFAANKVDIMGTTVDFFANQFVTLRDGGVISKGFLLHDWSRGGDGIVAKREIKSVEDLKGRKIATTKYTPSHFFLLYLLHNSGLSAQDILEIRKSLIFVDTASRAANLFVAGKADAAVTWEPDLSTAVNQGNGHKLVTTISATNLIGDVLVVREDFARAHPEELRLFLKGWFDAAEMIKKEPFRAYAVTAKALSLTTDDVKGMLEGLKFTDYNDNADFFRLSGTGPSHYEDLFRSASTIWRKEGAISTVGTAEEAFDLSFLQALKGAYGAVTPPEEEFTFTAPQKGAKPLMHKKATIHFATGSAEISADSKYIVDEIGELMLSMGNSYLKVEGNTDSTGNPEFNRELSHKRARAVSGYLAKRFKLTAKRFVVAGNGPDKPVASNATPEGRELNRRTDFMIITNE